MEAHLIVILSSFFLGDEFQHRPKKTSRKLQGRGPTEYGCRGGEMPQFEKEGHSLDGMETSRIPNTPRSLLPLVQQHQRYLEHHPSTCKVIEEYPQCEPALRSGTGSQDARLAKIKLISSTILNSYNPPDRKDGPKGLMPTSLGEVEPANLPEFNAQEMVSSLSKKATKTSEAHIKKLIAPLLQSTNGEVTGLTSLPENATNCLLCITIQLNFS
ncbi:hypothetical protein B0H14DRAFT_2561035 [Mycena olivaceomarginata]|nr:hypothetical protein B0H14DRAFT_2561035 [Mycena olivaceomarginata]